MTAGSDRAETAAPSPRDLVTGAEEAAWTDPVAALTLLEEAITPLMRRSEPATAARASYLRARLLSDQGHYDEALGAIRTARRDWLVAGNELEALRTDLGTGTVLIEVGDHQQAIDVSERLLESLDAAPGSDPTLRRTIVAGAHGNIGNAHTLMGNHRLSLQNYDVAANLFAALGRTEMQAQMDANGAIAMIKLGMAHRAVAQLRRAREVLLDLEHNLAAAKTLPDLAEAQLLLGQPFEANRTLVEAEAELEQLHAVPELARLQLVRAQALSEMGLRDDAHRQAHAAADTFRALNMLAEGGEAARLAGLMALELQDRETAASELSTAERLSNAANDKSSLARTWLLQGHLAAVNGRDQEARTLGERALSRFLTTEQGADTAEAHLYLAHHALDPDEAAEHLASASAIIDRLDLPLLGLRRDLVAAHLAAQRGDLTEAARILETAFAHQRSELVSAGGHELYLRASTGLSQIVDQLIHVLVRSGTDADTIRAWQFATRASRSLLTRLGSISAEARATTSAQGPDGPATEVWHKLSDLYDEYAAHESRREVLGGRIRDLQHRTIRHYLLQLQVPPNPDPAVAPVPEYPVLHFHVTGADVIAFVLRDGYADARILTGAAEECRDLVRQWRSECARMAAVTEHRDSPAESADVDALLRAFGEVLLEPLRDLLADLEGEALQVNPHRHLHAVPFEALPFDGATLGDTVALWFSPGRSAHGGDATAPDRRSPRVLAVPDDVAPEIGAEARAIADGAPGAAVHVGEAATADTLLSSDLRGGLLHLACHGEFHDPHPVFSRVRMADRWVTGAEMTGLDLTDSDVILSCCDLGRASDVHTEALGFTWSLFVAGARSVVACNWSVDDGSTALFMKSLHVHLGSGAGLAQAVDLARRDVRRAFPHPYHWAPFRYFCS
ncbi:CHAT domain-containing protein [Nocardioides panacisoli]|uniref:CHAT domain-containing protein n=1 Tax=Nocardioides panacisoli TaxID=627624 RepID=UPI001C62DE5C|nr:CHAT domain-containing protein [Nocardioides panacisoli]QYJ02985.1 CHAT domain-containing protein [Nocardioides panacisoli]